MLDKKTMVAYGGLKDYKSPAKFQNMADEIID
jgi:hypothetical protein